MANSLGRREFGVLFVPLDLAIFTIFLRYSNYNIYLALWICIIYWNLFSLKKINHQNYARLVQTCKMIESDISEKIILNLTIAIV
jgi:hypothetical protein